MRLVRLCARGLTAALRYLTDKEGRLPPIVDASCDDDDDAIRTDDMSIDTKHGAVIPLDEKALTEDDQVWRFTGYASIFGSKDLGNDVVVEGAFSKSLRDHGMPLLLFQHKHDECPVGTITEAREDRRGLYIKGEKGELPKDDSFCRDRLVPQLKRRGLKGMSIGYRALETEKRKSDGVRLLKEIRLYECSFVSMPMHPQAGVETIKQSVHPRAGRGPGGVQPCRQAADGSGAPRSVRRARQRDKGPERLRQGSAPRSTAIARSDRRGRGLAKAGAGPA
jgi:HK97 family phage prohead protease